MLLIPTPGPLARLSPKARNAGKATSPGWSEAEPGVARSPFPPPPRRGGGKRNSSTHRNNSDIEADLRTGRSKLPHNHHFPFGAAYAGLGDDRADESDGCQGRRLSLVFRPKQQTIEKGLSSHRDGMPSAHPFKGGSWSAFRKHQPRQGRLRIPPRAIGPNSVAVHISR